MGGVIRSSNTICFIGNDIKQDALYCLVWISSSEVDPYFCSDRALYNRVVHCGMGGGTIVNRVVNLIEKILARIRYKITNILTRDKEEPSCETTYNWDIQ